MPVLLYVLVCTISALLAKETRIGFVGTLLLALLLTPVPILLGIFCFAPRSDLNQPR